MREVTKPNNSVSLSDERSISYFDANLLDNPLCFFAKKDLERLNIETSQATGRVVKAQKGLLYIYRRQDSKSGRELIWQVQPDAKRGWCGPLDLDVIALIQMLATKDGELQNPIILPSWRKMCDLISRTPNYTNLIKQSVERIASTVIETNAYFVKGKNQQIALINRRQREQHLIFTLWGYYREGEELPDGSTRDSALVWLNEPFASSLKSFHLRPYDFEYFIQLPPLAKRIYLIQGRKFFGLKRSPYTKEEYTQWCLQLPITLSPFISEAKRRLERSAHAALIETGFLDRVEWVGTQKRQPWELRYYPGPRALEEVRRGKSRLRQLRAREGHQKPSGDGFDASLWMDLLTTELKDTKQQNKGFYFKLGKAIDAGLIKESHVWSSLSIAKDTMLTHRLKKELSACFTDELKRALQREGKDLKDLLSKI